MWQISLETRALRLRGVEGDDGSIAILLIVDE